MAPLFVSMVAALPAGEADDDGADDADEAADDAPPPAATVDAALPDFAELLHAATSRAAAATETTSRPPATSECRDKAITLVHLLHRSMQFRGAQYCDSLLYTALCGQRFSPRSRRIDAE
jgi:hypothetical protein